MSNNCPHAGLGIRKKVMHTPVHSIADWVVLHGSKVDELDEIPPPRNGVCRRERENEREKDKKTKREREKAQAGARANERGH